MSCEAWKWLAIATAAGTLVGAFVIDLMFLGFLWLWRPEIAGDRFEQGRPYYRLWGLCAIVSVVSVVVYIAHCA